jgi:hypothetical protein
MDHFTRVIEENDPDDLYISAANLEIAGTILGNLARRVRAKIQSVRIKRISDNTFAKLEAMHALESKFQGKYAANIEKIISEYPDTLESVWSGLPPFHGMLYGKDLSWGYWEVNERKSLDFRSHKTPISSGSADFDDCRRQLQAGIWRSPDGFGMSRREIVIQSGGQTGVDRTALDFAIELGLAHTGWCPRNRRAEDGRIADRYVLQETASDDPAVRTRTNICTSDATVILSASKSLSGGTLLTRKFCHEVGKPCLHLSAEQLEPQIAADRLRKFILDHGIKQLNVAGPRESEEPAAADYARRVLKGAWRGQLPADSKDWQIVGWLVPAPTERAMLKKKIDDLASRFGVTAFVPHVTVLAGGMAEPEALEKLLHQASKWTRPLTLNVDSVKASKEPRLSFHARLRADRDFDAFRDPLAEGHKDGFEVDNTPLHLNMLYRNRGLNASESVAATQIVGELPKSIRFTCFQAVIVPRDLRDVVPSKWRLVGEVNFYE